jgi:hypothetical protein
MLNPYAMMFPSTTVTATQPYYPFASMCPALNASNLIYSGAGQITYAGPFYSQIANVAGYYPDQLKLSFVSTQSALNAQGKITAALYYTPPNFSLQFGGTGTYNGLTSNITSA